MLIIRDGEWPNANYYDIMFTPLSFFSFNVRIVVWCSSMWKERKNGMSKKELVIRYANPSDSDGILEVYRPYVTDTTITYEYEVPTKEEFYNRTCNIIKKFPYLVCEDQGTIVGYVYASTFRERAAYQWAVEISVYVKQEYQGAGIATHLYNHILKLLEKQGFYKVYAVIDVPNEKSESFHKKFGFKETAMLTKTAYKMGKWCDIKYYEKELREYDSEPTSVKPFNQRDSGKI